MKASSASPASWPTTNPIRGCGGLPCKYGTFCSGIFIISTFEGLFSNYSHIHNEAFSPTRGFSRKDFHVKSWCFSLLSYFIIVPLILTIGIRSSRFFQSRQWQL